MPNANTALARDLDQALEAHRVVFETLHAEVRQATLDYQRVRDELRRRGPVRGGQHYLSRPRRERLTTLPMHGLPF